MQGHSMTVRTNTGLGFRVANRHSINGMIEQQSCGFDLDGEVTFDDDAYLQFQFDEVGLDLELPSGEYTLVSAKKVSGTAPMLSITEDSASSETLETQRFSLRLEPTRLVLVVAD